MRARDYADMFVEEETHWWYVGMRAVVDSLLPPASLPTAPRTLDAGCGTGYNAVWLRRHYGAQVTGLDYSAYALPYCRKRQQHDLVQGSVAALPFPPNSFDFLTCFEVLTQLEYDHERLQALREIARVLRPGGYAVLRVAALKWLTSSHDIDLRTYHRYGGRDFREGIESAGLRIVRFTFANTLLFPVALLWRSLKKTGLAPAGSDVSPTTRGPAWLNRLMTFIIRIEAAALRGNRISLHWGTSLVAIGQKPGTVTTIPEFQFPNSVKNL
jgi:ubiquinone/menaquinone biosynthesis C-methylase UbiE